MSFFNIMNNFRYNNRYYDDESDSDYYDDHSESHCRTCTCFEISIDNGRENPSTVQSKPLSSTRNENDHLIPDTMEYVEEDGAIFIFKDDNNVLYKCIKIEEPEEEEKVTITRRQFDEIQKKLDKVDMMEEKIGKIEQNKTQNQNNLFSELNQLHI